MDFTLTAMKAEHMDINFLFFSVNSLVIRQKGESQNGCFKKAKHVKIFEKQTLFKHVF